MSYEKKIDGGGSAFPCPADNASGWHAEYGMSLRDWFAGQALSGMFRHDGWINTIDDDQIEVARRSYAIADAMIAARKAGAE